MSSRRSHKTTSHVSWHRLPFRLRVKPNSRERTSPKKCAKLFLGFLYLRNQVAPLAFFGRLAEWLKQRLGKPSPLRGAWVRILYLPPNLVNKMTNESDTVVNIKKIKLLTSFIFKILGLSIVGGLLIPYALFLIYTWFCNKYHYPQVFTYADFMVVMVCINILPGASTSVENRIASLSKTSTYEELETVLKNELTRAIMRNFSNPLIGLIIAFILFRFAQ